MKNIAIIGSGISGLTCAYLLSRKHKVTVFEKNDRIGGHTATVDVTLNNTHYAIDTGFIVFNDKTYPNFLTLLDQLSVQKQPSEMSFSVKSTQSNFEYNGHNINTLFAQRKNIFSIKFWLLIRSILKFNKLCKARIDANDFNEHETLGDLIAQHQFSDFFAKHYLLPMGAAIWSSSIDEMLKFPLAFFVRFFNNHGLLNIQDRPQWYVIPNGSRSYLKPLTKPFAEQIHLNSDITQVSRTESGVTLLFKDGSTQVFDDVVFACHSDQAMALLADITDNEQQVLGNIPYTDNEVVLHTDTSILPKNTRAWASWNYHLSSNEKQKSSVTYNMNILQGIESADTFCVTLNQTHRIDPAKIINKFTYAHPVFSQTTEQAQKKRKLICGMNNTHFVGAYWYNGFHEDGVNSAIDVAERFNCPLVDIKPS